MLLFVLLSIIIFEEKNLVEIKVVVIEYRLRLSIGRIFNNIS